MRRGFFYLTMVLTAGFSACLHRTAMAPSATEGRYVCRRIRPGQLVIDGVADEAVWRRAPVMAVFQTAGPEPRAAVASTVARMLWDHQRLYVYAQCVSPAFSVFGEQRDDAVWEGEAVEAFLAPEGPEAPYYEVNVNPDGVIFDTRILDWPYKVRARNLRAWAEGFNADIERAVQLQRNAAGDVIGWSLEMAIPFADLGFPDGPPRGQTWRFNICRAAPMHASGIEFSAWHPTFGDFHLPHRFAWLIFR